MPNMSYCRFRNTLRDLRDCQQHMDESLEDDDDERSARSRLVAVCKEIVEDYAEYEDEA